MRLPLGKMYLAAIILVSIAAFFYYDVGSSLTLVGLKERQGEFAAAYREHTFLTLFLYFSIYIIATAFSFPCATILTMAGGALFGFWTGFVVVSFASTIGATVAFWIARYFLRDTVQKRYGERLAVINSGMTRDGAYYLFTLRLVPVVPFFVINLGMGLTPISTLTFFWVSQVGMLFGTAVYVNAGTQLATIDSVKGIFSPSLLASFVLLGLLPIASKRLLDFLKSYKATKRFKKPHVKD